MTSKTQYFTNPQHAGADKTSGVTCLRIWNNPMPNKTVSSIKWPYRLFLPAALTFSFLLIFSGCHGKSRPVSPPPEASSPTESSAISDMSGTLRVAGISLETLKKADLHYVWSSRLPRGRATEIRQFFYHKGQLFVLTDDNMLYAFDGSRGTTNWPASLAPSKRPCSAVQFYQDRLLFMLGRTFVEVRQEDGRILQKLDVRYPVSTSAARSEDKLFVGSSNRRFYALRLKDGIPLWQNSCNDIPVGNITLTTDKVYFTTRDNMLYVSMMNERDLVWKFRAEGPVPGVIVDNNQCFLPSVDTNLYCFDPQRGDTLWKYMAGGSLEELPVLTEKAIYQPVAHKSLVCLERQPNDREGKLRWELPDGYCLLAENGSVSYCMTYRKELALMSNVTGKMLLSFYVPNMNLYARNNEDALIFLASKSGSIVALAPNKI